MASLLSGHEGWGLQLGGDTQVFGALLLDAASKGCSSSTTTIAGGIALNGQQDPTPGKAEKSYKHISETIIDLN